MREDFVDPLPKLQEQATLLFGKSPIDCFIVESNEEYFRVAVPGVEHYEGDPRLTLATETEVYPVRLTRQERRAGGYSYLLQRLDPIFTVAEQDEKSSTWASKNLSLGVAAALVIGCLTLPANQNLPSLVARHPDAPVQNPETSVQQLPVIAARDVDLTPPTANGQAEVRDRAVSSVGNRPSIVSHASMTVSSASREPLTEQPYNEVTLESNVRKKPRQLNKGKHVPSVKSLIEEGRVGRMQPLTPQILPWLLNDQSGDHWLTVGISDAALSDLDQFELGVRGLPKHQSCEAISQLAESLSMIGQDAVEAKRVSGFTDIYVHQSNDANIYFRVTRGQKELVRVLPIEI